MKNVLAIAAIIALGAVSTSVFAEDADKRPIVKAPAKSLGDTGKLPPTNTVGGAVPDMRGPSTAATPADDYASPESTSPKGPPKRMGDSGKLPATSTVGGAVPDMNAPADSTK